MKKLIDQGGALREDKTQKIRYDLIPLDQLKRLAIHYTTGAVVHGDRNRETGNQSYADMCKQSAFRHFIQWMNNEQDEDHMTAVVWNLFAYEHLTAKNGNG